MAKDGGMALVTILLRFLCTREHSRFMFKKTPLDKSAFLAKPEIRLELQLEH